MLGTPRRRAVGAVAASALALALVPAGASGVINVMIAYNDVKPRSAELVPMSFPAALGPIGEIEVEPQLESRGRYGLLFSRVIPAKHPGGFPTTAANLLVRGYGRTPLGKEARIAKPLYHVSATTVRSHKGVLIRGKHGKPTVGLIWGERGQLYGLATGTPKTVSITDLQRTASALERLTGQVQGETPPEDAYTGKDLGIFSRAMIGERTALVQASWESGCTEMPANEFGPRAGGRTTFALALGAGGTLSFGPAPVSAEELRKGESASWTLGLSGTLSASGGQLTEQVSGTANGRSCAVGPRAFPLAPFHER